MLVVGQLFQYSELGRKFIESLVELVEVLFFAVINCLQKLLLVPNLVIVNWVLVGRRVPGLLPILLGTLSGLARTAGVRILFALLRVGHRDALMMGRLVVF